MSDSNEITPGRKNLRKKNQRPACLHRDEILGLHQWTPIPLAIARSTKLTMGAKLLYGEFMSWAYHNSGVCRPPQVVVAWHLNVTIRQMRRYQDELEEARAIVVVRRKSSANASKPNKIMFVRNLRALCGRERLTNKARVWRPAIESARKNGRTTH